LPPAIRTVVLPETSRRKMSCQLLVSPATRFLASEVKTTRFPSRLMAGQVLSPLPWMPAESTLTRSVVPAVRSRRKTSHLPFVSLPTRFVAVEAKAT